MLIEGGGENVAEKKVAVDLEMIPAYVRPYLLSSVVNAVTEYFGQPGVQEKYEQWLKEKEAVGKREK